MTAAPGRPEVLSLVSAMPQPVTARTRLHANESPWDWLKDYRRELVELIERTALNVYPDPTSRELRSALAGYVGCSPENVTVGCGSDEVIKMVCEAFVAPGDSVVIPTPTFGAYAVSATVASGLVRDVPSGPDLRLDLDRVIRVANETRARLVFLCAPHNPTGASLSRDDVLRVVAETTAVVVCDEAYAEFSPTTVIADAVEQERLVVLRTLSKAFGLAALRVGYAAASPDNIAVLDRVRLPYNLSALTQAVATLALRHTDRVRQMVAVTCRERDRLASEAATVEGVEVFPSAANFVLLRTPRAAALAEELGRHDIAVRRFAEPALADCVRISLATPDVTTTTLTVLRKVHDAHL